MTRKSTKDLITGVASTLFATKGFRHTTMETIAAAAGRGRRTVYMYFRDKVEIYNAVVDREISAITGPLRDVVRYADDIDTTLKKYASVRIEGISNLLERNPLLMRDFAQGHNRVEKLREKLNSEEIKIIRPFLDRYSKEIMKKGKIDSSDLSVLFLNLLRGNDRLLTLGARGNKISELNTLACDVFLNGIRQVQG